MGNLGEEMTFESKLEKKLVTFPFEARYEAIACANFARWAREQTLQEVCAYLESHYLTSTTLINFKEMFGVKDE